MHDAGPICVVPARAGECTHGSEGWLEGDPGLRELGIPDRIRAAPCGFRRHGWMGDSSTGSKADPTRAVARS
jgi:hypothetical protein